MKRVVVGNGIGILATVLWVGLMLPHVHAEIIDGVVATVSDEPILQSDLMEEIGPLLSTIQAQATSQEAYHREVDKALREALDTAIERKILYREAQLAGLEVADEDVEERLQKIKKQYDSEEAFLKVLEEAGETMRDFRERMRKQIMAISMGMRKRHDLEKEAVISESEMAQYYQDHVADYSRPERVQLYRIFLTAEKEAASRAKTKAQLQALRQELVSGADFETIAKKYSEGPDAETGGLVGWVMRGDLVETLEKVVFSLEEGEISEVVETEWGFHVLKAQKKEAAGVASYEEVRTEIEPLLRAQYADERYQKWMGELRKRSRVRVFL